MLLRASSEQVELDGVTKGSGTGIPHDEVLLALVDAVLTGTEADHSSARNAVIEQLGPEALVDVAGVIGTFEMQTRLADATGLPLDTPMELATRSIRKEIGADGYNAAQYVDRGGLVKRALAKPMERLVPALMRRLSR